MGVLLAELNREMFLDQGRIEIFDGAGCNDASVIDHQKGVAEPARHLDVLFGQAAA